MFHKESPLTVLSFTSSPILEDPVSRGFGPFEVPVCPEAEHRSSSQGCGPLLRASPGLRATGAPELDDGLGVSGLLIWVAV